MTPFKLQRKVFDTVFPKLNKTKAAGCCLDNYRTLHLAAKAGPETVTATFKAWSAICDGTVHESAAPYLVDLRAICLFKLGL